MRRRSSAVDYIRCFLWYSYCYRYNNINNGITLPAPLPVCSAPLPVQIPWMPKATQNGYYIIRWRCVAEVFWYTLRVWRTHIVRVSYRRVVYVLEFVCCFLAVARVQFSWLLFLLWTIGGWSERESSIFIICQFITWNCFAWINKMCTFFSSLLLFSRKRID